MGTLASGSCLGLECAWLRLTLRWVFRENGSLKRIPIISHLGMFDLLGDGCDYQHSSTCPVYLSCQNQQGPVQAAQLLLDVWDLWIPLVHSRMVEWEQHQDLL